jgi:xanthine dehydrogenase accessory factor
VLGPPPRLLVIGAVDTADALCRAAGALGWHTIVADARAKFATRERMPQRDELLVAWPEDALRAGAAGFGDRRGRAHARRQVRPAGARGRARDGGVLRRCARLAAKPGAPTERLLEAGVPEEALERISGPCGLDIGAESPAETALSMLAEILAVRAGREGGRLRDAKTRIHAGTDL